MMNRRRAEQLGLCSSARHHHHQSHVSHARVSTPGPSRNSPRVKTSDRAGQLVPDRDACAA